MNKNNSDDAIRDTIINTYIEITEIQLKGLRKLKQTRSSAHQNRKQVGMSQVDLVEDVLEQAGTPLHISEIITRVSKEHNIELQRDSIVSALTKKVVRGDRFIRTAKNTFRLKTAE